MADYLRACLPHLESWTVKGDNSRPETISHLNRHGVSCAGAEKWEGCVQDGITHVRGFDHIYVHPRCTHTLSEFRRYRFKVDRDTKEVLPLIIDKHNHAMDAIRYGLDGYIQRRGAYAQWAKLAG